MKNVNIKQWLNSSQMVNYCMMLQISEVQGEPMDIYVTEDKKFTDTVLDWMQKVLKPSSLLLKQTMRFIKK